MAKRLITISEKNHENLGKEENASKLVDQLLTWYYSGAQFHLTGSLVRWRGWSGPLENTRGTLADYHAVHL